MKIFLIFFLNFLILNCNSKLNTSYNFDKSKKNDSVLYQVVDSFINKPIDKDLWIEYRGNIKDTIVYSIYQVEKGGISEKILPYKIFKFKGSWVFIEKYNEKNDNYKLKYFLNENGLYNEDSRVWPLSNNKFWYVKIIKNKKTDKYKFYILRNPWDLKSKNNEPKF